MQYFCFSFLFKIRAFCTLRRSTRLLTKQKDSYNLLVFPSLPPSLLPTFLYFLQKISDFIICNFTANSPYLAIACVVSGVLLTSVPGAVCMYASPLMIILLKLLLFPLLWEDLSVDLCPTALALTGPAKTKWHKTEI